MHACALAQPLKRIDSLRWLCRLDLSLSALQDCGTGRVSI